MAKKSDVSKWVSVPSWMAVGGIAGGGIFLWGRSFAVPNSTEFWGLAAQPLAQSVVGAGAITAALLALHNGSKTRDLDRLHHQQTMDRDRETNLRERYTTAAQQLGDEQSTIREAGVHALAALADDWLRHGADIWKRSTEPNTDLANAHSEARVCIHLLCSYLRANHRQTEVSDIPFSTAEQAVRSSIVGVLRERTSEWRRVGDQWIEKGAIRETDHFVIDLSRAMLAKTDWKGADLRNAIMVQTILTFADLGSVNFAGARLPQAELANSNLTNADFSRADLEGANLTLVLGGKTNFSGAIVRKATFEGAILIHADFAATDLRGAKLEHAGGVGQSIFSKETLMSDSTTWPLGARPSIATSITDSTWVRHLRQSEQR